LKVSTAHSQPAAAAASSRRTARERLSEPHVGVSERDILLFSIGRLVGALALAGTLGDSSWTRSRTAGAGLIRRLHRTAGHTRQATVLSRAEARAAECVLPPGGSTVARPPGR
jgi:hypothetical protein